MADLLSEDAVDAWPLTESVIVDHLFREKRFLMRKKDLLAHALGLLFSSSPL
jgi:hypothetical protein